jgi:hypothetical protein
MNPLYLITNTDPRVKPLCDHVVSLSPNHPVDVSLDEQIGATPDGAHVWKIYTVTFSWGPEKSVSSITGEFVTFPNVTINALVIAGVIPSAN